MSTLPYFSENRRYPPLTKPTFWPYLYSKFMVSCLMVTPGKLPG